MREGWEGGRGEGREGGKKGIREEGREGERKRRKVNGQVGMWRPEINSRHHFFSCFSILLFLRKGLSLRLELTDWLS